MCQVRDLEAASRVQRKLFPERMPEASGWEFAGLCRPARVLAGDYYDVFDLTPGYVGLALGDVAGKGLGPSLVMAGLHAMIRSRLAQRVFIDLDCDVFDPAFFPAVTHPLPFGLNAQQVLHFIDAVWSERVIGAAVSEFDPGRDRNDQSLSTLVWLFEYLLLKRHEQRAD